MNKKLQAYTITEVLLVIVLIGIVISIGYYAFSAANSQFIGFRKRSNKEAEVTRLMHALSIDLWMGEQVVKIQHNGFRIVKKDSLTVSYNQAATHWVRSFDVTRDTFNVQSVLKQVLPATGAIQLEFELGGKPYIWAAQVPQSCKNQLFIHATGSSEKENQLQ